MPSGAQQRAVFLDRDGVLNELVVRDGIGASPRRVDDFRVCEGAAEAVHRFRELGMRILVTSNQPDVARGLLAVRDLARMTEILQSALPIDEVVICPHDDADQCNCRKPKPGMLLALADRWNVNLSESFLIGDSWKDVEAGRLAGCRTILVSETRTERAAADHIVPDLGAAVATVESLMRDGCSS